MTPSTVLRESVLWPWFQRTVAALQIAEKEQGLRPPPWITAAFTALWSALSNQAIAKSETALLLVAACQALWNELPADFRRRVEKLPQVPDVLPEDVQ